MVVTPPYSSEMFSVANSPYLIMTSDGALMEEEALSSIMSESWRDGGLDLDSAFGYCDIHQRHTRGLSEYIGLCPTGFDQVPRGQWHSSLSPYRDLRLLVL